MSIYDYKDIRIVYRTSDTIAKDEIYKDCKCNIGSDYVILTSRLEKYVYFNLRYVIMIQEVDDLEK